MDRENVIKQIDAEIKIAKIVNEDYTTVDLDVLESALAMLKNQAEREQSICADGESEAVNAR